MKRVLILALIMVAALGTAACGSSSKNGTAANAPTTPASTPSTPSTAGTSTTPGAKIPPSTPIGAPVVRAKFITEILKGGSPPQATKANAGKIADCAIAKLKAEGVTTAAGLKDTVRLSKILVDCAKPHGVTLK